MSWAFLSESTVCRDMRCHKIVDLDTLSVIALRSHRDDNAVLILNLSYLTRCGGRGGVVTKWHQEEPRMLGPRYKIYNPKWSRKCVVLDYPSVIKPPTLTGWPGINRYTLSDYSTGLAVAFPYFFLHWTGKEMGTYKMLICLLYWLLSLCTDRWHSTSELA